MTKNADPDKNMYSGQGIGLDTLESFSLSDGRGFCKNVMIFGTNIRWSVYIDNKNKYILIFCKCPTDGLDDCVWLRRQNIL